jgi:hypothetical protein
MVTMQQNALMLRQNALTLRRNALMFVPVIAARRLGFCGLIKLSLNSYTQP